MFSSDMENNELGLSCLKTAFFSLYHQLCFRNETVCWGAVIILSLERFRPNTRELWCYNAVVADARLPSATDMQSRCSILSPELALPTGSRALTTRSHAALHILGRVAIW